MVLLPLHTWAQKPHQACWSLPRDPRLCQLPRHQEALPSSPSSVIPQVLPLGTFSVEMRGVSQPWLQGEEDFLGKLSWELATQRSRAEQPCGGSTPMWRALVGLGSSGEGENEHTAHRLLPGQQRAVPQRVRTGIKSQVLGYQHGVCAPLLRKLKPREIQAAG